MNTSPLTATQVPKSTRIPDWVFIGIFFFLAASLFYRGHLYSKDTSSKFQSALQFVKQGTLSIEITDKAWGFTGKGGRLFPPFPIGSILSMLPPAIITQFSSLIAGRELSETFFPSIMITGMHLLYTTGFLTLWFIFICRQGISEQRAFFFSTALLFSTQLLHYSSSGWSEIPALFWGTLFITIFTAIPPLEKPQNLTNKKLWFTLFFQQLKNSFTILFSKNHTKQQKRFLIIGAFSLIFASIIRMEYIVFFYIFLFLQMRYSPRKRSVAFLFILALSLAPIIHLAYNQYRFGSMFSFGYFTKNTYHSNFTQGILSLKHIEGRFFSLSYVKHFYSMFLSFGRVHLFWSSPLVLLLPLFLRYRRCLPAQSKILFYSSLLSLLLLPVLGPNSWCWGNRYFLIIMPYLLLPVFFMYNQNRPYTVAFVILLSMGTIISVLGTIVNYHVVLERLVAQQGYEDGLFTHINSFYHAPFWAHLYLFGEKLLATTSLFTMSSASWLYIRSHCLDIWPVNMVAQHLPLRTTAIAWFGTVAGTFLYYKLVIHKKLSHFKRQT